MNFPVGTIFGAFEFFIAEITFYGETEGEDERLETMIENLGNAIKNSDFNIFDDSDINEALPDFVKLNAKRKELLLELDNIFPFTGSYRALINILKYFYSTIFLLFQNAYSFPIWTEIFQAIRHF